MKGTSTLPPLTFRRHERHERSTSLRRAVYALLGIAVALLPVAMSTVPPLADYPNHLARVHILTHLKLSPELAEYYRDVTSAQPNLAFDVVVGALSRVMPLEAAGRTFIALTIVAMVGGIFAFHRVLHGQLSLWPLLSLFFVYNRLLLWGFLAYLFTLGLALASFAVWIALDRHRILRIAVGTGLATLMYLGHLYAFGVYALCIAGYESRRLWQRRQGFGVALSAAAMTAIQFLPACYLFWLVTPTSGAAQETYWGSAWRKLSAPANVIFTYHPWLDLFCVGIVVAVILWGVLRQRVTFHRSMVGPLVLLIIAFVLMPDQLFSSYGADRRLTVPIVFLAIAASTWHPWDRIPAVLMSASFIMRLAVIAQLWIHANTIYGEYLDAIHRIPAAAKLMVVVAHPSEITLPAIPAFEIANLAVVYRHAFVPSVLDILKRRRPPSLFHRRWKRWRRPRLITSGSSRH